MGIAQRWIDVDGLQVRYLEGGRGDPLVLLHGAGADSAALSWKHTFGPLSQVAHIYAPDLPGHGGSRMLPGPPTTEAFVEWLTRTLDAWGLRRVRLVGLSLGGAIALGHTLTHPQRTERLVLVSSYGLQQRAPLHAPVWLLARLPGFERVLAWARLRRITPIVRLGLRFVVGEKRAITPDLLSDVSEAARSQNAARVFYAWLRTELQVGRLRTFYGERLHRVGVPTLIVHGERDRLVPVEWARRAAARMPNARLCILAGCGHWPPRERPGQFNRLLTDFLDGAGVPSLARR
ncbi:MAG: alpha/beta fold hydrolase [Armatimonadota bacterium]|nr:alpha/beta fold hydrolase [Armatimonadota bacterium]MDR5696628.1 alpha/beta fold hydrolase [Armatimonadota bacterium]